MFTVTEYWISRNLGFWMEPIFCPLSLNDSYSPFKPYEWILVLQILYGQTFIIESKALVTNNPSNLKGHRFCPASQQYLIACLAACPWVLLLMPGYLVLGVVLLPFFILMSIAYCVAAAMDWHCTELVAKDAPENVWCTGTVMQSSTKSALILRTRITAIFGDNFGFDSLIQSQFLPS